MFSAVQLVMDWVVFIRVRDDKRLPFTSDLSAPQKHKQTLVEKLRKKKAGRFTLL